MGNNLCSKGDCCQKCEAVCDQERDALDAEVLSRGGTVNLLSAKVRLIVEMEAETSCKMDVVLYNRSRQICGQMSNNSLHSFHRSDIECFEDSTAHVLQLDTGQLHDEIEAIEYRLAFAEPAKRIHASIGLLEDVLTREAICEFDLTRLPLSGHVDYRVGRIKRSVTMPDSWIVEAILDFASRDGLYSTMRDSVADEEGDVYIQQLIASATGAAPAYNFDTGKTGMYSAGASKTGTYSADRKNALEKVVEKKEYGGQDDVSYYGSATSDPNDPHIYQGYSGSVPGSPPTSDQSSARYTAQHTAPPDDAKSVQSNPLSAVYEHITTYAPNFMKPAAAYSPTSSSKIGGGYGLRHVPPRATGLFWGSEGMSEVDAQIEERGFEDQRRSVAPMPIVLGAPVVGINKMPDISPVHSSKREGLANQFEMNDNVLHVAASSGDDTALSSNAHFYTQMDVPSSDNAKIKLPSENVGSVDDKSNDTGPESDDGHFYTQEIVSSGGEKERAYNSQFVAKDDVSSMKSSAFDWA